jgi:hypothetical protein
MATTSKADIDEFTEEEWTKAETPKKPGSSDPEGDALLDDVD